LTLRSNRRTLTAGTRRARCLPHSGSRREGRALVRPLPGSGR
jgi:hypothetical protein